MPRRKSLERIDEIDIFYEYGLYVPARTIVVESVQVDLEHGESGVDAHLWSRLQKGLDILEHWPVPEGKENTITIVMNNPGGDAYHMLGMYDRIRTSSCPITIEASGMVMSAASIIFQAADWRRMHLNATMMIHHGEDGFHGNAKNFQLWAQESKRLEQVMYDIFLARIRQKNPEFTQEELEKMMNFDRFIPAEEAVELGLADEIISHSEHG